MTPKNYYYTFFRQHFEEFLKRNSPHDHSDGIFISNGQISRGNLLYLDRIYHQHFLSSLAFTILIDQLIYTYFKNGYPKFKKFTLYPKIELGITGVHVNPWSLVRFRVSPNTFAEYSEFFINDYKQFFSEYKFKEASWTKVKEAFLNDKDVAHGIYGKIFLGTLISVKD